MSLLLPNERLLLARRQHWSVVAPAAIACLVAVVGGVIVLQMLPTSVAGRSTSDIVGLVRLIIVVGAILVLGVRYLQWRAAEYLLTDHRIVVTRGVISRVTESITLDRVQDVIVRQSLGARLIGAGTLDIESAGRDGIEELHRIPDPQSFYNELMGAMDARRTGAPPPVAASPTPRAGDPAGDGL